MSDIRDLKTALKVKNLKGNSFVGIRNYESKTGEISNYTFLVGADYMKAKQKDIETVKNCDLAGFNNYDSDLYKKAKESILASLEKPKKVGQPYENLGKGLKFNELDNTIHVDGFLLNKTVVKPIEKETKKVNSRPLTLAQNELKKALDLRTSKYRTFKVQRSEGLAISGVII